MGRLRQAARTFADSTLMAARPLRWAVRVYSTTGRETTGLVEVERIVLGGGDRFWVQVRNSVYLADDDLIWIIKDTAAQGNWTFAGFVEGGGTGESPADSPIPSVAAPVYTAPDNMPVVIRPPAGEDMTLGRAGETIDVAGGLTVAEGITFSNLGAGIVQASATGVLSSDYIIDATMTMATATNIVPTDASGQDLGDITHRWDLYTQGVIFGGATGANIVTMPDNLADALHLSDAGGIEYMRVISTDAQPAVMFNDGGVDVDFIIEAVGHADALQVQGSDGQITLGMLTQGIVSSNAGGVLSVTAGSAVVGSGANTQVAYWTAANTLAGDAGMTYDAATDTLTIGAIINQNVAAGQLIVRQGHAGDAGGISIQGGSAWNKGAILEFWGENHGVVPGYADILHGGSGGPASKLRLRYYDGAFHDQLVILSTGFIGINGVIAPSTAFDIGAGAIEMDEMTAPGAGAANTGRLYLVDNAGKTELYMIFNTGAAQLIAAQP